MLLTESDSFSSSRLQFWLFLVLVLSLWFQVKKQTCIAYKQVCVGNAAENALPARYFLEKNLLEQ